MDARAELGLLAHPCWDQRECAVTLDDDQVLRPGEPPAVHNLDRLTEAGMERVVNDDLTRQTPGIATLPRPAPARVGSPVRSATRRVATIDPCSIIACRACSICWRSHAVTGATYGS